MRLVLVASLLLGGGWAPHAQKPPDFSGTWAGVSPAENAGNEQVITQTAAALTMGHDSSGGGHVITYKLDGSESRNEIAGSVTIAKARWEGERLVIIESTTYTAGRKVERTLVWSLDKQGQLVVEFTGPIAGSTEMRTRVGIYRRK